MTHNGHAPQTKTAYSGFRRIHTLEDWFEIYEIAAQLYVFYEPRHYEGTIVNLVIGDDKAALIDTGCGIGNLRTAVAAITQKPVMVINTHTHPDHLGNNSQFDEIAMFDHPLSRHVSENGISHQILEKEILAENLVSGAWPGGFDPGGFHIPPFQVSQWFRDGERLSLGGKDLEVIHAPGEAPDHICLLDRADRVLFCGDILLDGPVWTHLEGGSLKELVKSYRKLMSYFGEFDRLMPGHNQPWVDKDLLPETLEGAEKVLSGQAEPREIIDPWRRRLKQHSFGRFQILTR